MTDQQYYFSNTYTGVSIIFCCNCIISACYTKAYSAFCTTFPIDFSLFLCYFIDTRGDTNVHVNPSTGSTTKRSKQPFGSESNLNDKTYINLQTELELQ